LQREKKENLVAIRCDAETDFSRSSLPVHPTNQSPL
jgi:hypothetical protein